MSAINNKMNITDTTGITITLNNIASFYEYVNVFCE